MPAVLTVPSPLISKALALREAGTTLVGVTSTSASLVYKTLSQAVSSQKITPRYLPGSQNYKRHEAISGLLATTG